ncbi:MAG: IMP dehydrogenase, partial [Desulfobulbaceae bacterium]
MGIHIALHHKTSYKYDRLIHLAPHIVRLRPAPHCRTPILSYSMQVIPAEHFINWQQDPFSNYLGRLVFPEKTREFHVEVDLVADMIIINPFDYFLEPHAEKFPFTYESRLRHELRPYLSKRRLGKTFNQYVAEIKSMPGRTIDFLVELNMK